MSAAGNVSPRLPLEGATEPHPDGLRIALGSGGIFYLYPPAERTQAEADAEAVRTRVLVAAAVVAAANTVAEAVETGADAAQTIDEWVAAEAAAMAAPVAAAGADALRAALEPPALSESEEACVQAVRAYLQGFAEAAALEGVAAMRGAEEKKPKKRGRPRRLPTVVPQQTWPEFEAVIFGVAVDGRTATQDTGEGAPWQDVAGEAALMHRRKGSPLSLHFGASAVDDPQTDYVPLRATSCDELRSLLERVAGPRTAHLFNYAVARGRVAPEGFTVAIDELVNATGPRPRNRREAAERRVEAWAGLRLFGHIAVYGRRKAYRPKKGEPDTLFTRGPLIAFTELAANKQLSLDGETPPREVTLVVGPWLARLVTENPGALPYFTDDRAAAQLPSGRGAQAWRDGISWALAQRLRQDAKHATERRQAMDADEQDKPTKLQTRDFTRRELLDYLNPEPHYADVLASAHPLRAVKYWDDAVVLLRKADIIGAAESDYVEHGPAPWRKPKDWPKGKPFKPQGWGDAWLDEPLTIRPGPGGQAALQDVQAKAPAARKKRAK